MPEEPIRRIVVLTHTMFNDLRIGMVDPLKKQPPLPKKLKSLIEGAIKDPHTHVIITRSDGAFPHDELEGLLKKIPRNRRYVSEFDDIDKDCLYAVQREGQNFFVDDPEQMRRLKSNAFAPEVEIESWGDAHSQCHSINVSEIAEMLIDHGINIKKIHFVGGMPTVSESLLNNAARGETIPKEKHAAYEKEREVLLRNMKEYFGDLMDRVEIDWPPTDPKNA